MAGPVIAVGIDPSLTCTGVSLVDTATGATTVHSLATTGRKTATLRERHTRIVRIARWVEGTVTVPDVGVVAIERLSFGQSAGAHHDRSGLWWMIVDALAGHQVIEVSPKSLKKYATGTGNAGKDAVLLAVSRRYPGVAITNNDEADALVLAAMAARAMGHPLEASLPQAHMLAYDTWIKGPR